MQPDGVETGTVPVMNALHVLQPAALAQVVERGEPGLARDKHRRGQPVGKRQLRTECQDALCRAQALCTPAHEGDPQMMAPFLRFELNGFPRGRERFAPGAGTMPDERERTPGVAA